MADDDDRVFKALADPTRRFLLDRLFARDGRSLTELESELELRQRAAVTREEPVEEEAPGGIAERLEHAIVVVGHVVQNT